MNNWINRIHRANKRADLSKPINISSSTPNDIQKVNDQLEVDLTGDPTTLGTSIEPGDTIYIAVKGDHSGIPSTRIVAKGIVLEPYPRHHDSNGKPYPNGQHVSVVTFVKGSFEYLKTPMINGLDEDMFFKDLKLTPVQQEKPYYKIKQNEADYIDLHFFSTPSTLSKM